MNHFFFSMAFRPLFLLAACYAPVILLLWLLQLYWQPLLNLGGQNPLMWHSHEMLYGFVGAGIGGFLFTAVANWTGRKPVSGLVLVALCIAWMLGRLFMLFGAGLSPLIVAVGDLSYLVMVAILLWRELYFGQNKRNYIVLGCILLLLMSNVAYHLESAQLIPAEQWSTRGGIGSVLLLLTIIGGRIVPAFTRNWLQANKPGAALPTLMNRFDAGVVLITALIIPAWVAQPENPLSGVLILIGGIIHAVRISRWKGLATLEEPLLLILHIAYSWIPVGLILLGAGIVFGFPANAGVHALTVGAITTMIMAVAARAGKGHSGRPLVSDWMLNLAYVCITATALSRLVAAFTFSPLLVQISGLLWLASFVCFLSSMAKILLTPAVTAD